MAITNLLATMVLVSDLNVIQTYSPEFQEYAYHAMTTNAQAIAMAWHLDVSLVSTNHVTHVEAAPGLFGIKGYIEFDQRYHFVYDSGWFNGFLDFENDRMITKTPNIETNNSISEQWMQATNLLTLDSARLLAANSLKAIGVSGDFKNPKKSHQLKYEWKDGKTNDLPYYGFDWSDEKHIYQMEVSGINGKVVDFFAVGATTRLVPPTNYYHMLGLPNDPIFVNRVSKEPSTYEIVLDPRHPPEK